MANTATISPTIVKIWKKLRGTNTEMAPAPSSSHNADDNAGKAKSTPLRPRQTKRKSSSVALPEPKMSKTAHHKFSDITPMPAVTKSPYEPKQSAEAGEPIFERLKKLLLSREEVQGEVHDLDGSPTMSLQDETIDLFGQVLATSFVKANHVIGKSGILFSPLWVEDKQCKIRGIQCGWISKPMMLLLLQEQRFSRADEINLTSVVNLLGVGNIFFDALREWKLDQPRLESSPTLQFTSKKRECLKCLIFVARVYRCIKVLRVYEDDPHGWLQQHEPGIFQKIKQCLDIMNKHVKVNPKRMEEIEMEQESKRLQSENRKRLLQEVITAENDRRQLESQKKRKTASLSRAVEVVESSSTSSSSTPMAMRPPDVASELKASKSTIVKQVSRRTLYPQQTLEPVEQKSTETTLEVLKKEYRRLGRTIKKLEKKIQEDRDQIREELRKELLEEGWRQPLPTRRKNLLPRKGETKK